MTDNQSKLDELSKSYKGLSSINGEVEKRVKYLETRAINLVTSYLFLQILIFFCISSSSSSSTILLCKNWWTPVLSVLVCGYNSWPDLDNHHLQMGSNSIPPRPQLSRAGNDTLPHAFS
ncbi:hypothetical protein Dsin_017343 [Dipteronia sinensis]|uniref:Uncharacterized protein n=1 Tax=Dipteronia sinensis TaxID=43782 RepID=A0AAE0AG27_9ROSI|nr:hypothetical protein Dsin_017343 [Dipteronia sinensis]